jgi:hypothetical protein
VHLESIETIGDPRARRTAGGVVGSEHEVVVTENSVRSENTEVMIIREIMVTTTMSSLFVALFYRGFTENY